MRPKGPERHSVPRRAMKRRIQLGFLGISAVVQNVISASFEMRPYFFEKRFLEHAGPTCQMKKTRCGELSKGHESQFF